ncbi:MAG: hypothetical protein WCO84_06010, partial [bacterium]
GNQFTTKRVKCHTEETKRRGVGGDLFSSGASGNATLDQISKDRQRRLGEISGKQSELSKWSPDTVTYGKMADGKVGFMTVGQQEYALDKEKRELEEKSLKAQEETAATLLRIEAQSSQQAVPQAVPQAEPSSAIAARAKFKSYHPFNVAGRGLKWAAGQAWDTAMED